VGRIASQFETLLTTINGYSELALMDTPESNPLRQELQHIVTASNRASSLTRHLVAFSGNQLMPLEPVDLSRLVKNMQAQLREAVPCPIDFDLQPMEHASLANVDCVQEVILLLCGSARGRMRAADRLQVRTGLCDLSEPRYVESGELSPGMYGALTISDSGRPLDAQCKEHLFEPLSLIHQDMGVELSAIYGIVQSLGGGIDVVSGDDIGTTFEILLPCVKAARAATA
jgi:two-component system, cell cycle sensor histidine kinase and response regulator CckA